MINSSRRRSLILSSRQRVWKGEKESTRASDAFWGCLETLNRKKVVLLWKKKSWKKKEKKEISEENFCRPSVTLLLRGTQRQRRKTTREMSAVKKLIPLMDRVLVERAVAATKTSGGILLPETVGSKVSRMNSHSHSSSSSSSSLVFFLWISILVYRLLVWERERERALQIGRTFSLRAETEDDDGRVFFFFIWWVENSRSVFRVTDDWMMFLSFFLVLLNNYSSTPASSSPSDRGDRVQWTGN